MLKTAPVDDKLSLPAAVLINLNIMLGAGIFINTVKLSEWTGGLGCLMYPLIGLLLLPLIISIAKLVQLFPDSGFYGYGAKALSPFIGFFSSWSYFTGKLASATLMIHVALSLVQQIIPLLSPVPVLLLDFCFISLFIGLNMLNVQTGHAIQVWFMVLKIIPILFSIFTGLYLFSSHNYALINLRFDQIPSTIPLVLYAASGFEAACSLSCKIRNAQRNGPLAIFISYGVMIFIAFLYQFAFYGAMGPRLTELADYRGIFPLLLSTLIHGNQQLALSLQAILYLAIAASALGSGYGILFSNTWNLYAISCNGHTFFKNFLTKLNNYGLPTTCIIIEGLLCFVYLFVTRGDQLSLQQTSALACSIAYTLSVISLLTLTLSKTLSKQSAHISLWLPVLALINCIILISSCIRNFFISGIYPLCLFLILLLIGITMFFYTKQKNLKLSANHD